MGSIWFVIWCILTVFQVRIRYLTYLYIKSYYIFCIFKIILILNISSNVLQDIFLLFLLLFLKIEDKIEFLFIDDSDSTTLLHHLL